MGTGTTATAITVTTATIDRSPWSSSLHQILLPASVFLLLAACGGDDLLLPRDGEPARISAFAGDSQHTTVGQALPDSLVAQVTDPAGRPVAGVEVTFVPPSGAIVSPADPVRTDADGRAAAQYTLSTVSGDQIVEARAPIVPETNAVASFHITANPEVPESLAMAGGNRQQAEVSTVLPESLAVMAVDRYGNGVPGIEVSWQANGGGDVSPATVVTGADGRAKAARTLGDRPGQYGAVARAEALGGSPVAFTATAVAAPQPSLLLQVQPSENAEAGVPLERQPELQLQDPFGAPLAQEGVSVTAQIATGSGSLGGKTTARSDGSGKVTFTDLEFRGDIGPHTLIFAADGFTPVTSAQITVRPGPPSADETSIQVPDGSAGAPTPITVRLRDEFGNAITGAAGDFALSVTGANPASNLPVSEEGSGSYTASYVPLHVGQDVITIEFRGVALGGGHFESVVRAGAADPTTTTARVTASGVIFIVVQVEVVTRDAQGNLLNRGGDQVVVVPNGGQPRVAEDRGDGTYVDQFVMFASGISVAINLNGVPLSGSPFSP
jgi:hypothetical protein